MIELTLPPKVLSPNVKPAHWSTKSNATRWYREGSCYAALAVKPKTWRAQRIEIDVEYRCSKWATGYIARDIQNAMAAMKAAIDGLIDAGVAPNDSKAHLTWGEMTLITRRSPKGDGITVTVRERT